MQLKERIQRRWNPAVDSESLIQDYAALSPAAHIADPVDRGSVVEWFLTQFDAGLETDTANHLYLHGPRGSGKSAIVIALLRQVSDLPAGTRPVIHTSTRVERQSSPVFVYVDSREVDSEFAFYRTVLDEVIAESVPETGVGTDALRERVRDRWRGESSPWWIAVDHLDARGATPDDVVEWSRPIPESVGLIGIGQRPPAETPFGGFAEESRQMKPYQHEELADVIDRRASTGLTDEAIEYPAIQRIAEWADGDAHDALTALFLAADRADSGNQPSIDRADADAAVSAISQEAVALDQVFSLPDNRQAVLREVTDLTTAKQVSVPTAAALIADGISIDLSEGTVKRFLYEAAEDGFLERHEHPAEHDVGRVPSWIESRFSAPVFNRLYDLKRSTE